MQLPCSYNIFCTVAAVHVVVLLSVVLLPVLFVAINTREHSFKEARTVQCSIIEY